MGTIFTAVLLLFVAISVVWSVFVRKLIKTRIRSISVIVCVALALIGTVVIKNSVLDPAFVKETLLPMISPSLPAEVAEMINASAVLLETAIGLPVALVSPLIFVVLYIVFYLLAGIVYLFILLFGGRKLRRSEKNHVPYAKVRGIAWSAVSAALSLVVILLPIAFYGGLVDDVIDAVAQTEAMDAETMNTVKGATDEFVNPIVDSTAVQMFRVFGGDAMIDELAGFKVNGENVYLKDEVGAVAELVGNIMPLTQAGGPQNYGEKEADSLVAIANALPGSKFLTAVAAEAVYFLTEDLVNSDEPISLDESGMFDGLINKTIVILHDDAKDTKKFTADVKTVAEMASALIKGGVMSNMNDTDALFEELAGGDTIENVIVVLGKNGSMKCLIPEVTNIGIKAIASFVEVKADAEEAYTALLNTIADDINSVKSLDSENQVAGLSAKLADAFDHAGIVMDDETVELYATAMLQELGGADATADDVQGFFANTTAAVDTTALKSVEEFEKATLLVFLEDLVIDVDEATKLITDETVEGEAEAIGDIFSQAGTLMNDVSGEVNIGTMAESVGGILNSLQDSVCVGKERTANLFIAIVQSGVVRDAANMDIATATELGEKGSTGENVDYAKTFKTISNAMDVLQNMNTSTEGGMTTEDLTVVLKDLNPQTAGMIESYITEDRLEKDYGLSADESATAAPLISDVFGYMGSADMTEEECAAEAEALNDVMTLVTSANDKANSGEVSETVFGAENSVLGKTADDTVKTFMASESIKHSLNNNSESLGEDPFGMGDMMVQDGEKDEKLELEIAMKEYYETTEYETAEEKAADRETMINLGKLFGFTQDEMHFILSE